MASGGGPPPQGFDIQNFFKNSPSPSPSPAPSTPYNLPNHPYPHGSPFSPQPAYPPSSPPPGSFPFPNQSPSGMHPYLQQHYSQDHVRPAASFPFIQSPYGQPVVAPLPQQSSSSQISHQHSQSSVSSPPLDGARLMALLTTQSTSDLRESSALLSSLELPPASVSSPSNSTIEVVSEAPPPAISPAMPSAPPVSLAPQSNLKASGKLPKGRFLNGERVVYDIDNRMGGEEQPQLEVSTITVYGSDPMLVLGRQIAVNKCYICYGLRAGTIRILNINTALRSLFRGHTQRVIDMSFVSSDVHVLASTSTEGRVFVRKVVEGVGSDGQNQITEQILVGLQFAGDWESVQPRVCWHSRQDILLVGMGKYVVTVDVKLFRTGGFSADEPVKCNIKSPVEGVSVLGNHEDEVTGLAACPGTIRFASSSKDGTVRIWADTQLVVLGPHAMAPVYSVAFLAAPRSQDHVLMVTAGPLNRELKVWAPAGSDGLNWKSIQTLELKSSTEKKVEDAFFNQMVVVPHASVILLANAKRNAIYALHLEFGHTAASARLDYLAEFSVTMPILSFTTDNPVHGEGVMQVYCVQTQAIQQHALDLALCLPPVQEANLLVSDGFSSGALTAPVLTTRLSVDKADSMMVNIDKGKESPSAKANEQYSQEKSSPDPDQIDKAVLSDEATDPVISDTKTDANEKEDSASTTKSSKPVQPHLITPFELMSMVARSKTEVAVKAGDIEEGTKDVEARVVSLDGETGISDSKIIPESFEDRRRGFVESTDAILDVLEGGDPDLQAEADSLIQTFCAPRQVDDADADDKTVGLTPEDIAMLKEAKAADYSATSVSQSSAVSKGRKNKNKANAGAALQPASTIVSPPEAEASGTSAVPSEGLAGQLQSMQESLNQLVLMHKDLQKQFPPMINVPIAKEGKRMETALGQRLEKTIKANVDAMLAKLQEENVKREKAERERSQQLIATLTTATKELPATVERIVKKELTTMGPAVAKILSPAVEKAVSTVLADSQALNEKTLPQLEKAVITKLETCVARQLQSQFQTTGRQALQEAMRTCFEGSVVPSFERSCKAMFEQVDGAFQKGMTEHISHAQQQASASHSALAATFQESVNSLAQTLKSELADGQRKIASYSFPVKPSSGALPDKMALSLQHVEETLDPTIEISRLLAVGKLEEAFNKALSRSDVAVVSWLCNQIEPSQVFSTSPPPLSQGVLLSLVQQLGCDLGKDTARKLTWIQGAALALNPSDPVLAPHMRPFLEQLYQNLHRQVMLTPATSELASSLRLVVHVVNSLLSSCK